TPSPIATPSASATPSPSRTDIDRKNVPPPRPSLTASESAIATPDVKNVRSAIATPSLIATPSPSRAPRSYIFWYFNIRLLPVANVYWRMTSPDHGKLNPAIVVRGWGPSFVVSSGAPSGRPLERSDLTDWARVIPPAMLSSPVPCSSMLKPARGCAVYMSSALTRFGVSRGFAWSIKAAAPDAIAADTEVPLRYIILESPPELRPVSSAGKLVTSWL